MAWIRLDDDYIYHPKFAALSHGAFRLWHEGIAYCRKLMSDGVIPFHAVKAFRYAKRGWIQELLTPAGATVAPLWERLEGIGYLVHDYLIWNRSKEQELKDRDDARERANKSRAKRVTTPVTHSARAVHVLNMDREEGSSSEKGSGEKPRGAPRSLELSPDHEVFDLRAGQLLERYAELFLIHRKGARYHNRMHLDFQKAQELVRTWADDARLEKLAEIILTTDDEWISRTDRGFGVFAAKASWADDKLTVWEADQKATH